MLEELIGEKVVVDFKSEYVCLGTITRVGDHVIEMKNADFHDLRDTDTTRENYIAESVATGVKRNRRKIMLFRSDIVAISKITDVVDG